MAAPAAWCAEPGTGLPFDCRVLTTLSSVCCRAALHRSYKIEFDDGDESNVCQDYNMVSHNRVLRPDEIKIGTEVRTHARPNDG